MRRKAERGCLALLPSCPLAFPLTSALSHLCLSCPETPQRKAGAALLALLPFHSPLPCLTSVSLDLKRRNERQGLPRLLSCPTTLPLSHLSLFCRSCSRTLAGRDNTQRSRRSRPPRAAAAVGRPTTRRACWPRRSRRSALLPPLSLILCECTALFSLPFTDPFNCLSLAVHCLPLPSL